jgi:hypothetical protein
MTRKHYMQQHVRDHETTCDIPRQGASSQIQTRNRSYDNGENWDVRENKRRLANRVRQTPQQRNKQPFVIRHRIQFVSKEQGQA